MPVITNIAELSISSNNSNFLERLTINWSKLYTKFMYLSSCSIQRIYFCVGVTWEKFAKHSVSMTSTKRQKEMSFQFHFFADTWPSTWRNQKVPLYLNVLMIMVPQISEMTHPFQKAQLAHLVHSFDAACRGRIIAQEEVELVIVVLCGVFFHTACHAVYSDTAWLM